MRPNGSGSIPGGEWMGGWILLSICIWGGSGLVGDVTAGVREGLAFYCGLESGDGSAVPDTIGGTSGIAAGATNLSTAPGVTGNAVRFSDWRRRAGGFTFRNAPQPGAGDYTVSLWFKLDESDEDQFLIGSTSNRSLPGWTVTTGNFRYVTIGGTSLDRSASMLLRGGPPPIGEWQHLAIVMDTVHGEWRAYLNGSDSAFDPDLQQGVEPPLQTQFTPGTDFGSDWELYLGHGAPVRYGIAGSVDEVAIWKRALAPAEITSVYAHGLAGLSLGDSVPGSELPVFASEPGDLQRTVGQQLVLAPEVTGAEVLSYRWWKDGQPLVAETQAQLRRARVSLGDAGSYLLAAANPNGGAITDASVTVKALPVTPDAVLRRDGNHSMGSVLAIDGNLALVSAIHPIDSVILFERMATESWVERAVFSFAPIVTRSIGGSIAIDGKKIFIGLPSGRRSEDNVFVEASVVVIEPWPETNEWRETARIQHPNAHAAGSRLEASNGLLVIGDPGGQQFGVVSVLEQDAGIFGKWNVVGSLLPRAAHEGMDFGRSIAVIDDTIVVGAPEANLGSSERVGAAFVYERVGGNWRYTMRLNPEEPVVESAFGFSVGVSGDSIAIGAPGHGVRNDSPVGTLSIFSRERPGGAWSLSQRIPSRDFGDRSRFGTTLAMDGEQMIAGYGLDYRANDLPAFEVMERRPRDGLWLGVGSAFAPGNRGGLGAALALSGRSALISAPQPDSGGVYSGTVHAFQLPPYNNSPPEFVAADVPIAATETPFLHEVRFTDEDGDPIDVRAVHLPDWLKFSSPGSGLGVITGTPALTDAGRHEISLSATDSAGAEILQALFVDVSSNGDPLTVLAHPAGRRAALGRSVALRAVLSGGEDTIEIQWLHNGAVIPGEQHQELLLTNLNVSDAGTYQLRATSGGKAVITRPAELTVLNVENAYLVPTDFPDIQQAIDAVAANATLFIEAGDYEGQINLRSKAVRLIALDGPEVTRLIGVSGRSVPWMKLESGSAVEGFHITAGAIVAAGEGVRISNCVFEGEAGVAPFGLMSILVESGSIEIEGNIFRNLPRPSNDSASLINVITGTTAFSLVNNLFADSPKFNAVSIQADLQVLRIVNNTFAHTRTGFWIETDPTGGICHNNIFSYQSVLAFGGSLENVDVRRNLIFPENPVDPGATGLDAITSAPKFVNAPLGDYRLRPDSPALGAALADHLPATDVRGASRAAGGAGDLGAYEGSITTPAPTVATPALRELTLSTTEATWDLRDAFSSSMPLRYSARDQLGSNPGGFFSSIRIDGSSLTVGWPASSVGLQTVVVTATTPDGVSSEQLFVVMIRPEASVTVPDDFPAIQAAIDSIRQPTIVLVKPGTYEEQLRSVATAAVFLQSTDGPDATIIQSPGGPGYDDTVFRFGAGEISGFTVRGAERVHYAVRPYGGMFVANNIFENFTLISQGIVSLSGSTNILHANLFRNNSGDADDPFFRSRAVFSSGPQIVANNVLFNNDLSGITAWPGSRIIGNTAARNRAGVLVEGNIERLETVIAGNLSAFNRDGFALHTVDPAVWRRNLAFGNDRDYVDLSGNTRNDNVVVANPNFVDLGAGDLRLNAGSPAIDAGIAVRIVFGDYLGFPRVRGRAQDIGALEFQDSASPPFQIDSIVHSGEGTRLLFEAVPMRSYAVEYSGDAQIWKRSPVTIKGGGAIEWIDRGPPATDSFPSSRLNRYYRVRAD